ncbi:EamA family transporter [Malaciobacter molluscorum LMG 25693]|uniref:EamA family transporter n=1 Tax=Malaciobacter molluscorum LMG 25693 TaxID=870501 RepID=A0A2G1DH97_9BACT|nr:DMT family transporter [Malaciobacter molluscorum]AXX91054.1 EamA/RhaT family transporter [Malaciobacter molluscorum LMG 25693]PHO17871.1 EamA family transporter [Malaciobacter molluscorum LMG 25693]
MNKYNLLGIFSLIFAMFIWGSSFVGLKIALASYNPYTIIFIRMVFASLCFLFFIKEFLKYKITKKDFFYIILLSLFEPCLYFVFEVNALQLTTASQAGMITSLMPLITSVAAVFILKELISKQFILGSFLAVFGSIWLSLEATSSLSAPNPILGNFLEFLAMTCAAGYTIIAKHLTYKFSALFITASQAFIGAIFFLPFASYEFATSEFVFNLEGFLWIMYLGVVVTLGGYGLYNFALTKINASKVSIYINLIPVFTLILAFFILKEQLSFSEIFASFIILFGVFVSQIKIIIPRKIFNFFNKV